MLVLMQSNLVPLYPSLSHCQAKPPVNVFINSTNLQVCHNLRILRHREF
ncbi:hypothetical protein [Candidatus Enterovibrio escicola]|nr:hypothetical protein [Candidatus Enterovibrio escacola]